MLLHPAAFWLKPWRPEATTVGDRFIFGPYPIEPDFQALRKQGVSTVISLLDADLPYEAVLLSQETALARKYGMRVLNFPMASILGQSFGKDYVANSKAAAQAALDSKGIVYLHCYLGLHRAANVQKILQADDANYQGTLQSGRSPDTLALDRANLAFIDGNMEESLRQLALIKVRNADAILLEGWARYRLNQVAPARASFQKVVAQWPDRIDAVTGLGMCALRTDDLAEAERQFSLVLAKVPDDPGAMEGLGHVRYRQTRLAEARALFARVLEKNPDNVEVREILGKLKDTERHVVVVVVDGLRPDALAAAPAPRILELIATGASTLSARPVGIPETLPSLVTVVTGLSPARHGIDYDNDRDETLKLPTLFTRVHEGGGRSALYFAKRKVVMLAATGTVETRHGPGLGSEDGPAGAGAILAGQFASEFRKQPFELALIHLREPDFAGHQKGWMSPEYLAAVRETDAAVDTIRRAIADSGVTDRTTLILTADHGGEGTRHGSASKLSWIIPWICQGPRVRRGTIAGTVTLLDVAPTALALLGLPPLPQAEGHAIAECLPQ